MSTSQLIHLLMIMVETGLPITNFVSVNFESEYVLDVLLVKNLIMQTHNNGSTQEDPFDSAHEDPCMSANVLFF